VAVAREGAPNSTAQTVDHFLSATPLLAKVGRDLPTQYRAAMDKEKEAAGLRALLATDAEPASGSERVADLRKMAEAAEKGERQLEQRLVTAAKERSRRVAPRVRATLGPFVANLRRSVSEAREVKQSGADEVLSLEAAVLDAMLDGFSTAGWRPDGKPEPAATASQRSDPARTAGRPSRATTGVAAAVATDRKAKAASAEGEVFSP
jgi:hypothetical protein